MQVVRVDMLYANPLKNFERTDKPALQLGRSLRFQVLGAEKHPCSCSKYHIPRRRRSLMAFILSAACFIFVLSLSK